LSRGIAHAIETFKKVGTSGNPPMRDQQPFTHKEDQDDQYKINQRLLTLTHNILLDGNPFLFIEFCLIVLYIIILSAVTSIKF
jgi:hypothetical protein